MLAPGLHVVATPIGNLKDISQRAVETLRDADCIAAEDTRHSSRLLRHLGIDTAMRSLHEHNEAQRIPEILQRIRQGQAIALISDAGTPMISDPGYRLVQAVVEQGMEVFAVPGACAVVAALTVAGLPTDRFTFEGFLPAREAARVARLRDLSDRPETLVFFESSHRIKSSLANLRDIMGQSRNAAVCRELTKQFETVYRGSLQALNEQASLDPDFDKGEFVVVVAGAEQRAALTTGLELARALCEEMPASQAARVAAKISGESRRDLYRAISEDPDQPRE